MYSIVKLEPWEIRENRVALTEDDRCYYYMTYNPFSDLLTNDEKQTITNIKISPEELQKTPSRAYWKNQSIREVAQWLTQTLKKHTALIDYLWLPAPSSKTKNDAHYDDRLQQILTRVNQQIPAFKWFDALYVKKTVEKSRQSNQRNVQQKLGNLTIDKGFVQALPLPHKKVVVFDDVLTSGATYKAAQLKIKSVDASIDVIGIFIAKAIRQEGNPNASI